MRTDAQAADFLELGDPIELVARFAVRHDWLLKQTHETSVLVEVPGQWGQYQLRVDWQSRLDALCVEATFDMLLDDVPATRLDRLLSDLNSHLFLGHFRLSADRRQVQLHYVLALRGAGGATCGQIEDVVDILIGQCEQAAPAFARLLFSPDAPAFATELVMAPVAGEA